MARTFDSLCTTCNEVRAHTVDPEDASSCICPVCGTTQTLARLVD